MNYRLINNYQNLSYDERYKKATHYYQTDLDKHNGLLGYVDEFGTFVSVLISIHIKQARKNFDKYDYFKMKTKTKH